MRRSLTALAGLLLAAAAVAGAPERLTAAEAAQVDQMAQGVEQQCNTQALAELKKQAANSRDAAAMDQLASGDYCSCIGRNVRSGMTPTLLRHGTAADGQKLVHDSANDCAAQNFKAKFPSICRAWAQGAAGDAAPPPGQMDQACACAQKRVDQITGDTLAETTRESVQDYERWRRNPGQPQQWGPMSFTGNLMSCFEQAGIHRQAQVQAPTPAQ